MSNIPPPASGISGPVQPQVGKAELSNPHPLHHFPPSNLIVCNVYPNILAFLELPPLVTWIPYSLAEVFYFNGHLENSWIPQNHVQQENSTGNQEKGKTLEVGAAVLYHQA